jgi:hypothetical protein
MKSVPFGLTGVAAAAGLFIFSALAGAETRSAAPADDTVLLGPIATITFADGSSLTTSAETGLSELIALDPQETVQILLTFPTSLAGQRAEIQSPDGGTAATAGNAEPIIHADGTVALVFQIGAPPGQYRITAAAGGAVSTIRLWVPDPENESANPQHLVFRRKHKAQ